MTFKGKAKVNVGLTCLQESEIFCDVRTLEGEEGDSEIWREVSLDLGTAVMPLFVVELCRYTYPRVSYVKLMFAIHQFN